MSETGSGDSVYRSAWSLLCMLTSYWMPFEFPLSCYEFLWGVLSQYFVVWEYQTCRFCYWNCWSVIWHVVNLYFLACVLCIRALNHSSCWISIWMYIKAFLLQIFRFLFKNLHSKGCLASWEHWQRWVHKIYTCAPSLSLSFSTLPCAVPSSFGAFRFCRRSAMNTAHPSEAAI